MFSTFVSRMVFPRVQLYGQILSFGDRGFLFEMGRLINNANNPSMDRLLDVPKIGNIGHTPFPLYVHEQACVITPPMNVMFERFLKRNKHELLMCNVIPTHVAELTTNKLYMSPEYTWTLELESCAVLSKCKNLFSQASSVKKKET